MVFVVTSPGGRVLRSACRAGVRMVDPVTTGAEVHAKGVTQLRVEGGRVIGAGDPGGWGDAADRRRHSPGASQVASVVRPSGGVRRVGVLDLGSNSAQLQIADLPAGGPPLPAYAVKHPTLLSHEVSDDGAIRPSGIERVVEATRLAMQAVAEHRVDDLYVFATAAIRSAANRDRVLNDIEAGAGVRPQFLSGEDEARLTYLAARLWYGWAANRILLMDIGGGSLEIALGRNAEPEVAVSLPLGAGRLTREFLRDDPPRPRHIDRLRAHSRATLREVTDRVRWERGPVLGVATSKTFKQLARLTGSPPQRAGPFASRHITNEDLTDWIPRLAGMPSHERARLRGISATRAEQILAGAVVAKATMDAFDLSTVALCPWALREGIMLHHLQAAHDLSWTMPLAPLHPDDWAADPISFR